MTDRRKFIQGAIAGAIASALGGALGGSAVAAATSRSTAIIGATRLADDLVLFSGAGGNVVTRRPRKETGGESFRVGVGGGQVIQARRG